MQCNIDQRGRTARIVTGAIIDLVGAALLVAGILTGGLELIVAGAVVSGAGMFVIFEGVKGWCVLRAAGIKTPL
ncbi:MAG: hypothetical protein WCS70_03695 [Verrucomicrobiota bacterium]